MRESLGMSEVNITMLHYVQHLCVYVDTEVRVIYVHVREKLSDSDFVMLWLTG